MLPPFFREGPGQRPQGLSQQELFFVQIFSLFNSPSSPSWKTAKSILWFRYLNFLAKLCKTKLPSSTAHIYSSCVPVVVWRIRAGMLMYCGRWMLQRKTISHWSAIFLIFHPCQLQRALARLLWLSAEPELDTPGMMLQVQWDHEALQSYWELGMYVTNTILSHVISRLMYWCLCNLSLSRVAAYIYTSRPPASEPGQPRLDRQKKKLSNTSWLPSDLSSFLFQLNDCISAVLCRKKFEREATWTVCFLVTVKKLWQNRIKFFSVTHNNSNSMRRK